MDHENLKKILKTFIRGENRSVNLAGELESALIEMCPDDEELEDFKHVLALYSPAGGEFLYGEDTIVRWCEWLLAKLE
jgi:hypothetical protein